MTIIAFEQAFLANEDFGDSLDSVEALFKKNDDFDKSLAAQEEKIKVCCKFLKTLVPFSPQIELGISYWTYC